jgi:hypothetical protein
VLSVPTWVRTSSLHAAHFIVSVPESDPYQNWPLTDHQF